MPEEFMIDKTVNKIKCVLQCAGLNIRIGERTRIDTLKSRIVYIFNFFWLNTEIIGAFAWFLDGVTKSTDLTELTSTAPCMTFACLATLKSLYTVIGEKKVYRLINILRKLENEERHRDRNPECDQIMESDHKFVTAVMGVLNTFYLVALVAFSLNPLFLTYLNCRATNEVELLLPFKILYPFDASDIRIWPFIYIGQIWIEIVTVLYMCSADYLFYIFCTYIRTQFRLLKYNIETIITIGDKTLNLEDIDELKTQIIKLIKWHQELIHITNILETLYTRSTLLNFMSSSLLICLSGFNVTATSDMVFAVSFLSFLFMSLLQIFFLCFFGDLLITASTEVSDAAYNCRWYLADHSIGKYLLIIQKRAQTPCQLTASKFSIVSLKAFMKILSTSWSYFALLQTLYSSSNQ